MKKMPCGVLILALLLGACATPRFSGEQRVARPIGKGASASGFEPNAIPTSADVVAHIQCELFNILQDSRFTTFKAGNYVVFASLTLEVTNSGKVNPTLSFIDPLATIQSVARKRTLGAAGKYVQTAHRTFSQTFMLELSQPKAGAAAACLKDGGKAAGSGIRGDLAIAETVAAGVNNTSFLFALPTTATPGLSSAIIPTFATTVDFTLLWDAGFNPGWTLVNFSGPSGSGGNLIDFNRTTKNTLTLSFASAKGPARASLDQRVSERKARDHTYALFGATDDQIKLSIEADDQTEDRQRVGAAAAAAQDSVLRLLLQKAAPTL